ncbi:DUF3073 domain-containing protein [Pseudoclavibacter chungangensis]|uniref:DUF3073 domain-containing protein n=1 Tax=Pseudoclavibacter chungangensis TaxID=587635 RepID=A0A7J5C1Q2_9MICO|nr:DUF3073 domain-containing protein [Pseudoclavibacter chungangensis]KAB1662548.1 DUF3073 domain-containing protein [Pseudoclavibacter chungangensis]NYJ68590.1 hypothetical protein [Pseudoclavibacter chungangensis]
MGRGRQKAKHTKVARELKYSVHETNYSELERELSGSRQPNDDELSKWSEYYDDADAQGDDVEGDFQQRRA